MLKFRPNNKGYDVILKDYSKDPICYLEVLSEENQYRIISLKLKINRIIYAISVYDAMRWVRDLLHTYFKEKAEFYVHFRDILKNEMEQTIMIWNDPEGINAEKISEVYNLLIKYGRKYNKPDLHSFKADVKRGTVFVDCYKTSVRIDLFTQRKNSSEEKTIYWIGDINRAASRLTALGLKLDTVDI